MNINQRYMSEQQQNDQLQREMRIVNHMMNHQQQANWTKIGIPRCLKLLKLHANILANEEDVIAARAWVQERQKIAREGNKQIKKLAMNAFVQGAQVYNPNFMNNIQVMPPIPQQQINHYNQQQLNAQNVQGRQPIQLALPAPNGNGGQQINQQNQQPNQQQQQAIAAPAAGIANPQNNPQNQPNPQAQPANAAAQVVNANPNNQPQNQPNPQPQPANAAAQGGNANPNNQPQNQPNNPQNQQPQAVNNQNPQNNPQIQPINIPNPGLHNVNQLIANQNLMMCEICNNVRKDMVFLGCNHVCWCNACWTLSAIQDTCPRCNIPQQQCVQIEYQ